MMRIDRASTTITKMTIATTTTVADDAWRLRSLGGAPLNGHDDGRRTVDAGHEHALADRDIRLLGDGGEARRPDLAVLETNLAARRRDGANDRTVGPDERVDVAAGRIAAAPQQSAAAAVAA